MSSNLITRTYLEIASRTAFRPSYVDEVGLRVERVASCPPSFFRYLYTEVGRAYGWCDRLEWTDEDIARRLGDIAVSLWVMYRGGAPAGYFELRGEADGSVELACFGLLPEFTGRGLGRHLLSEAVQRAWDDGARRVWLHTCTLDHPGALPNYLARGFTPFRTEQFLPGAPGPRSEP